MQPVLFSFAGITISSFGAMLSAAFLVSIFIFWRLAKIYDLNEEKVIDLGILTFFGGLFGARLYFVADNPALFDNLGKIFLVTRYPGLSFWGGWWGGLLAFSFFCFRLKLPFWQTADFAATGLAFGLALGNIGCFLGGCAYGVVSNLPIALPVVGLLGKRLPTPAIESILLGLVFVFLWKRAVRFHFNGKIIALFLIFLGTIKFLTEFYRGDSRPISYIFSLLVGLLGVGVFYRQAKRSPIKDLVGLAHFFYLPQKRQTMILHLKKNWYNQTISWKIELGKIARTFQTVPGKLKRKFNVRSNPKNI